MSTNAIPLFLLLLLLVHPSWCKPARKLALVPPSLTTKVLSYHQGPLLSAPSSINFYYLWYGSFSTAQKEILSDFASSFSSPPSSSSSPSVASWWSIATSYTDQSHAHVSSSLTLASQASVSSPSPPSLLQKTDILSVLLSTVSSKSLPVDPEGVYFIFTADDVPVEDFCMNSCGFHDSTPSSVATNNLKLPYAWIGNPGKQCPGYCAWPFALPRQFGPQTSALISPNKDVGMEGMVINMATVLAGTATNPFNTGYFQGDARAPLEAVSACTGIFGVGAFPGNPGSLFTEQETGASYNAHGANGRLFLLPAMWSPTSQICTPVS